MRLFNPLCIINPQTLKMKNSIFIILVLLTLVSCKKDKTNTPVINKTYNSISKGSEIETFYFPDTVNQNTMVKGQIKYSRNFGNVKDSENKERYIYFHVGTDSDSGNVALNNFDRFSFRLVFKDTIGDGLIEFQTVFTEAGINYLHGLVKDIYVIESSDLPKDSVRVFNKETIVTKKVVVLEEE